MKKTIKSNLLMFKDININNNKKEKKQSNLLMFKDTGEKIDLPEVNYKSLNQDRRPISKERLEQINSIILKNQ